MHFSDIEGHRAVKELLLAGLRTGRLVPFYLLTGPEGVGKSLLGRAFGRYLLCLGDRDGHCRCRSCRLYLSGNHPDLLLVEGEGELKMDDAIAARDFLRLKPYLGGRRFLLVADAERLNPAAQNALLKTLEEPPPATVIFFTTARPEALLETVLSRARLLRTGALEEAACRRVLERLGLKGAEAAFLAEVALGSPGRALSFRQVAGSVREAADRMLRALEEGLDAAGCARPVTDTLAGLETPAERRLFLRALLSVLGSIYRRRLGPQGSEPLGSVVSCLTEAYRAVLQNVRPELVVLVLAVRLRRALSGGVSPLSGVVI